MSSAKTPLLTGNQPRARQDEQIERVQSQIQDTQRVMQDNIHLAIQRGQDFNDLDGKSVMLENESMRFKEKSSAVKRNMCVQYYRQIAIIILIAIGIIGFISLMIYLGKK